jgi:predicted nucleic acid-binding protein
MARQVNVLLTDEQHAALRKLAWQSGTSVSAVVRVLVTASSPAHVENIKQQITPKGEDLTALKGAPPTDPVRPDES